MRIAVSAHGSAAADFLKPPASLLASIVFAGGTFSAAEAWQRRRGTYQTVGRGGERGWGGAISNINDGFTFQKMTAGQPSRRDLDSSKSKELTNTAFVTSTVFAASHYLAGCGYVED